MAEDLERDLKNIMREDEEFRKYIHDKNYEKVYEMMKRAPRIVRILPPIDIPSIYSGIARDLGIKSAKEFIETHRRESERIYALSNKLRGMDRCMRLVGKRKAKNN